ncbi:hypothetical protein AMAG_13794 [Allomyces macrogynus ATCC 38327]|uniref:Peptidase S8/S53 domain-containing protein n=1 Tax=Allomyces macrogynus (strain ATCC 38327) TaxID=578462 RepID=A0A0L0T4E8_ALLM3|nr:hypothetical protein AMAG_13794 [Allomyces macrogynus ATCC 38327]|eukprot:KNE69434.1 hypothetical protein AMAG_13794 [Allomyces macrogynus ATCC 38327]
MRHWTAAAVALLLLILIASTAAAFPPEPPTPPALPQRWIISLLPEADTAHALAQLAPLGLVLHRDRALTIGTYRALVVEPSATAAGTAVEMKCAPWTQRDPFAAGAKIATPLQPVAANVQCPTHPALDDKGQGSTSDVITALQWIADQVGTSSQLAIVNLSIGGFYSRALNDAVNAGAKNGLILIVAAGNESINACLTSPASATGAIAVGATNRDDRIARFSNVGACVEILAPGVNVTSASIRSKTAYIVESGTSFACPHVAGLLGLYAATTSLPALVERFDADGGWNAAAAKDALMKTLYDRAVKDQITIPFSVFSPTPNLLAQVWP